MLVAAEKIEDISLQPLDVEVLRLGRDRRMAQGLGRLVDGSAREGPGFARAQGEGTLVGETIENTSPGGASRHDRIVLRLVEIKSGLLAGPKIEVITDIGDADMGRRLVFAIEDISFQRQPFKLPDRGVVTGKDDATAGFLQKQIDDDRLSPGHRHGQSLQHENIVVLVHDESRQLVGLGPDESARCTQHGSDPRKAIGERGVETLTQQGLIQGGHAGRVATGNDLRVAVIKGAAEELALDRTDLDGASIFNVAFDALDFARENPGMPGENSVANTFVQDQAGRRCHFKCVYGKAQFKTYPKPRQESDTCLPCVRGYKTRMPSAFQKFHLFICTSGMMLFVAPALAQQPSAPTSGSTADSWVKFGIANGMKGDLNAAISAFDEAIKSDPKWAPAYECRGHALSLEGKLDDAMVDYNKAIEIDPNYQDAYYDRSVAQARKGNFDAALIDSSRVIELNPKYAAAYYNRGHVKYFKGDLDGAISDLNQAITLDPHPPFSYYIRGLARLAKDDREGASSDFQQSAINGYPIAAFWLWIVKMEKGDRGEAQSDLSDLMSKHELFKPDDWPVQIGNFLLEKTNADALLTLANQNGADPDKLCDVWFYSGINKRFAGDTPGAIEAFQKAASLGSKMSEIYVEAQRQAASLQKP